MTDAELRSRLRGVADAARAHRAIGFPTAIDLDDGWDMITAALGPGMINNIGDPWTTGLETRNTKPLERDTIDWLLTIMRADTTDWWGYVTGGSTEGNLHGAWMARARWPDAVLYHSDAAHTSIRKAATLLGLDAVVVPTQTSGAIDPAELARLAVTERPAILMLTAGTTMTEAVDDLDAAHRTLLAAGVARIHTHVDAALAGIPLALSDEPPAAVSLDHSRVDSLCVSGHKFLGIRTPCGVLVARRAHVDRVRAELPYAADSDATITGSRSGHTAAALWWAMQRHGVEGHRRRAEQARMVARYAVLALRRHGIEAWRNPGAFTVAFKAPPDDVVRRWSLATQDGWSHLIAMPGVTRDVVEEFAADMAAALRR
jgi:histidine decarboxylase